MIVRVLDDFKGYISLPNLRGRDPLDGDAITDFKDFINKEEPRLMYKLFGFELATEILNSVDNEGVIKDAVEERFKDLIIGKEDYSGLRVLIANYIYCAYIKSKEDEFTGMGVVREKTKNSERSQMRSRYVTAWREFYSMTVGEGSANKVFNVGGLYGVVWNKTDYYGIKPLRIYMEENKDDFPSMVDRFNLIENETFYGV